MLTLEQLDQITPPDPTLTVQLANGPLSVLSPVMMVGYSSPFTTSAAEAKPCHHLFSEEGTNDTVSTSYFGSVPFSDHATAEELYRLFRHMAASCVKANACLSSHLSLQEGVAIRITAPMAASLLALSVGLDDYARLHEEAIMASLQWAVGTGEFNRCLVLDDDDRTLVRIQQCRDVVAIIVHHRNGTSDALVLHSHIYIPLFTGLADFHEDDLICMSRRDDRQFIYEPARLHVLHPDRSLDAAKAFASAYALEIRHLIGNYLNVDHPDIEHAILDLLAHYGVSRPAISAYFFNEHHYTCA